MSVSSRSWLPVAGAVLLIALLALCAIVQIPFLDWSGARLASSASLLHGYRLYYGADAGPAMPTVYGPVSMLLYLPALLSKSITGALLIAGATNVLAMLLPLAWLHNRALAGDREARLAGSCGLLFAGAAIFAASPTQSMLGNVHVDAPAVGLGLSACIVLLRAHRDPGLGRLCASSLLAVLAIWTKQIEAPLILACLGYVAMRFGRRALLRQLACYAVVGVAVSAAFVLAFGFDDLWFNLFTIPNAHLARYGADGAALSTLDLALECAPFALGIAVFAWLLRGGEASFWERDYALPLLAAVLLFPVSAVARAKLGAWENSYHALYYLIAAASLVLASAMRRASTGWRSVCAGLTLVALVGAYAASDVRGLSRLRTLADNPQQQAVDFAHAHPGQAYFPWHPLATAYSDGKLYHFDYAVLDREFAGYRMSDAHIRAYLPDELRYVLFRKGAQDRAMLRYLPEFRARGALPEMPGWVVYARPGESLPGSNQ